MQNQQQYTQRNRGYSRFGNSSTTSAPQGPAVYCESKNEWSQRNDNKSRTICFWCGLRGHTKRSCYAKQQQQPVPLERFCDKYNSGIYCPGTKTCGKIHRCTKCRQPGHPAIYCSRITAEQA